MTELTVNERYTALKRRLFDKWLEMLNEEQRSAVYTIIGPLLVLAGAGSGKTTVLVKRIEYIIKYGDAYHSDYVPAGITDSDISRLSDILKNGSADDISRALTDFQYDPCPAWRVLAITFTNKAANEMKERLSRAFGDDTVSDEIWSGTFHKTCMRILRKFAPEAGLGKNYTIYDTDDSKKAVKAAMERLNLDDKQYPVKSMLAYISKKKEELITPEEALDTAGVNIREKNIAKIYFEYQNALSASNALDFDDIIMRTVLLLEGNEEIRSYYQNKFKYVLVDEYQDTNHAQFRLTELLSGGFKNLMVVGDDDQSIYKFRGATIENILDFDKAFPGSTVIKLEQNYRSTQNILDAANAVIKNNKGRRGKNLWTGAGDGMKLKLVTAVDQDDEARYVARIISDKVAKGEAKFKDFAVLYRANSQSRSFENTFLRSGIPYKIVGNVRFNEREEIKDMMAYFQLTENHADNERLKRIINKPRRKIGDKTITIVEQIASETNQSMYEVIENTAAYPILGRSSAQLGAFKCIIDNLTEKKESLPLNEFFEYAIDHTGYKDELISRGDEGKDKLDNLKELVSNAVEFAANASDPTLGAFLEESMLVSDIDSYNEDDNSAVLMTIHAAKGLEFPVVFLPGMEENLFPSERTIFADNPDEELEEERRLMYVAITRAKSELYIIHAQSRLYFGHTSANRLSRFAKEIPESLTEPCTTRPKTERPTPKIYVSGGVTVEKATPKNGITVNARPNAVLKSNGPEIKEGDRIRHKVFGDGTVFSAKRMANDTLFEVIFDKVGTKKLMGNYAHLEKI